MSHRMCRRSLICIAFMILCPAGCGTASAASSRQVATPTPPGSTAAPAVSSLPADAAASSAEGIPVVDATLSVGMLPGGDATTIASVLASPVEGSRVVLSGIIVQMVSAENFILDDGTGQVFVDGDNDFGSLLVGERVQVTGTVDIEDSPNRIEIQASAVRRNALTAGTTTPFVSLSGGATSSIGDVLSSPVEGAQVVLEGTITRMLSAEDFMLDDGTGIVYVDGDDDFGTLRVGDRVLVTGAVDIEDSPQRVEIQATSIRRR